MALFASLLVIVLMFIALILYSRQKMAGQNETLPATSDITAQINQTLLLSKSELLLALKLAERLSGEFQELALQWVAAEPYLAGHKAKALEIGRLSCTGKTPAATCWKRTCCCTTSSTSALPRPSRR